MKTLTLCLVALGSLAAFAQDDKLTDRLRQEDPGALAAAARERGNVVRGAILFHQRKLDCGACHRGTRRHGAIGPDLAKMERPVTDLHLVQSLLEPSKVIKKGFESSVIRTTNGQVLTGRLVEQTPQRLILLDAAKLGQPRLLEAEDVERVAASEKSAMPDGLIDQLSSRQEFLDLLSYVIELSSGKITPGEQPFAEVAGGKPLGEDLIGLQWLGELKCAACHPADGLPLLQRDAPDLAWAGGRIAPEHIERFIADPAQVKHGTAMPNALSELDEAARRDAAKKITQFLLSQSARRFRRQPPDRIAVPRGRELFHTVGCVACHSPRGDDGQERLADSSVPLGKLSAKYNVDGLTELLENPHAVRPSGRMPSMRLSHWEARDLANYLLRDTQVVGRLRFTSYQDKMHEGLDRLAGKEHRAGLVGGFSLDAFDAYERDYAVVFEGYMTIPRDGEYTFHLSCNDAGRLTIDGRPRIDLPPMPGDREQSGRAKVTLTRGAHSIQLAYLQLRDDQSLRLELEGPSLERGTIPSSMLSSSRNRRPSPDVPRALDAESIKEGGQLFAKFGCAHCHRVGDAAPSPARATPLRRLRPDRGCMSADRGPWPAYQLDDQQRRAILAALRRPAGDLSDSDQIGLMLSTLRCVNCHQRGEWGGVPLERSVYFHTTDLNLGEQGRIPPTLTGVGAKLNRPWMRDVLVNGRSVRPYMKTRMPQYGERNVGPLIDLLQRVDDLPPVEFAARGNPRETRKTGQEMVGNGGLNCVGCHTHKGRRSSAMAAADLTEMAERLQKRWFYRYMRDPQGFSPNTVMPSFWPGGRALRNDLAGGDAGQQLEAIWTYLLEGRQSGTPRGLIREPMRLLATNEAVMLRRAYPNIGKRGIGVGYPRRVNLAFDAEQLRLAMLWRGDFADPAGAWTGQGSGAVRPMARGPLIFPKGPELDDAAAPWEVDDDRPPKHRFLGYDLDDQRRPRFRYRFENVAVEDYFVDIPDDDDAVPLLRRTITLDAVEARTGAAFRIAAGEQIDENPGGFLIDKRLKVTIRRPHRARIKETLTGQQLQVPLNLPPGKTTLVIEYFW